LLVFTFVVAVFFTLVTPLDDFGCFSDDLMVDEAVVDVGVCCCCGVIAAVIVVVDDVGVVGACDDVGVVGDVVVVVGEIGVDGIVVVVVVFGVRAGGEEVLGSFVGESQVSGSDFYNKIIIFKVQFSFI
jgi:hypothetical protein